MTNISKRINKKLTQAKFRGASEHLKKGVSKHSTLITFIVTTVGVVATIYFASKEVPKAKDEIKDILVKEGLSKKEKRSKVVKVTAKTCWKTAAVAISTILVVTSTSAITASSTAATVASLTNVANLAEGKVKDYEKAVNDIPDEEIKKNVQQSVKRDEEARTNVYLWRDRMTGIRFKATCQQILNASELTDSRITTGKRQSLYDFYVTLGNQGAEFQNSDDPWPDVLSGLYYDDPMNVRPDCAILDDDGETEWYIEYREPKSDF